MSGGVDSSAAAMLLQQQGYDVTGATLRMFSNEDLGLEQDSTCCSLSDVEDAKLVAHKLGIPHYVFNFSEAFQHMVMDHFAQCYACGLSANTKPAVRQTPASTAINTSNSANCSIAPG